MVGRRERGCTLRRRVVKNGHPHPDRSGFALRYLLIAASLMAIAASAKAGTDTNTTDRDERPALAPADAPAILFPDRFERRSPSATALVGVGVRPLLPGTEEPPGTDLVVRQNGRLRPLTSGLEVVNARLSPDERFAAYTTRKRDLHVRELSEDGADRVIAAGIEAVEWRDGQSLVVQKDIDESGTDPRGAIAVLTLADGRVTRLTEGPDSLLAVSPDGASVAFARAAEPNGIASLFTLEVRTRRVVQRTNRGVRAVTDPDFVQTPAIASWPSRDTLVGRYVDDGDLGTVTLDLRSGTRTRDVLTGATLDTRLGVFPVTIPAAHQTDPAADPEPGEPSLRASCSPAEKLFRRPIDAGQVTAGYDNDGTTGVIKNYQCTSSVCYDNHTGVDFADARYTPVRAMRAGTVYYREDGWGDGYWGAQQGSGYLGNQVRVDSGNGWKWALGHGQKGTVAVKTNQGVSCSQQVMQMGTSGWSSGTHTHAQWFKYSGRGNDPMCGACSGPLCFWSQICGATGTCR